MVRLRTMWISVALAFVAGAVLSLAYVTGWMAPQGVISTNCRMAVLLDGDDVGHWDLRFGTGKGAAARELCELIAQ